MNRLQRAYLLGYRRGLNKARGELRTMAQNFDADIARLQDKARADRHAMVANFDAEIAKLQDEARKELHSLAASFGAEIGNAIARQVHREKINRAVEEAANERATIPDTWLN